MTSSCCQLLSLGIVVLGTLLVAEAKWTNQLGRHLVVMAAPSIWDVHYRENFFDIIRFQIDVARQIQMHENVIVLADKHTLPYLSGRSHKVKQKLPKDVLVEANIYDIHIRDFAPFGNRHPVKFTYRSREMDEMVSKQIDKSMLRFLKEAKFRLGKNESEVILSGSDVVTNGVDKAIINLDAYTPNDELHQRFVTQIKLYRAFRKVAPIMPPVNFTIADNTSLRLDDMMAFVDDNALVIPMIGEEDRRYLDRELWKKFRDGIKLIDLPTDHNDDYMRPTAGTCGMYAALLATKDFVYVPMFGRDPSNWKMGHSSMLDKVVLNIIAASTRKTVVPINIPRHICQLGLGLRGITWDVRKSTNADKLVQMGRLQGRRRFLRL